MTQHITLSSIADHILEVKTLDDSSLKHLENCAECRADLQWLKVLRNLGEVSPPETAVSTAVETFKTRTDAA
jgi:hypothetical protein